MYQITVFFLASIAMVAVLWIVPESLAVQDRIDAPVITSLKIDPSTASRGSQVLIRVHIFDRQGIEEIVPVLHLLREGIELIRTPVLDDGRNDDHISGDGFFTGQMTVPLTASVGNHWFVVFLYDKSGHRSNLLIYEFWVSEEIERI